MPNKQVTFKNVQDFSEQLESVGDLGTALNETYFLASFPTPDDIDKIPPQYVDFYNQLQKLKAFVRSYEISEKKPQEFKASSHFQEFEKNLQKLRQVILNASGLKSYLKNEKTNIEIPQHLQEFQKNLNKLRQAILNVSDSEHAIKKQPTSVSSQETIFLKELRKLRKIIEEN